jgi:midasin
VQHEAAQQDEGDDAAAAAADADDAQQPPPTADEYQFLGQHEQQQEGTTQALAPATEEQAALQGQDAAMQEQQQGQGDEQQDQQQQQVQDAGDADMDAAAAAPAEEEADASPEEKVATGAAPKVWSGSQQKPGQQQQQQDNKQQQPGAGDAAQDEQQQQAEQEQAAADAAAQQRQQLLDGAAGGPAAAEDADLLPSLVAAKLAATQLGEDAGTGLEADEAAMLSSQLPPEQAEALRAELDARIRDAAAAAAAGGQAVAGASADAEQAAAYGRAMWSHCEALVSGLSGELTEQLRLILEPSLASRLGGEFRSGKRLNMKRVIGYIASQFRRDKIWMRRSRPDKRRYQVVVAVDDSRSMAEHGAGAFALEALALLCKAMSRLEVGELGVVSYGGGGGVQPLQPLEVPFTDAAGPGIMSALKFDQDNTITDRPMLQLVEAVQHLLELARHRVGAQGGGSNDLRQLLLVLGDGRFHEKEALLGAVRRLVEVQGVCPVFIALDTAAASSSGAAGSGVGGGSRSGSSGGGGAGKGSSLLDMQSVKFVDGKPVFERYLDSFPFPYYIVLRDIAALPATLADLLRQWFELNASSS